MSSTTPSSYFCLNRVSSIALVLCLLSTSTPAAPQTIVGRAQESSVSFLFGLRANGLTRKLQEIVTGQDPAPKAQTPFQEKLVSGGRVMNQRVMNQNGKGVPTLGLAVAVGLLALQAPHAITPKDVSAATQQKEISTVAQVLDQSQPARLQSELITLRPAGFEPSQISRSEGQFVMAVNNQTGLLDLTIWLERQNGTREAETRLSSRKANWRARVNLAPGNYQLRVAEHPDWVCLIRITS